MQPLFCKDLLHHIDISLAYISKIRVSADFKHFGAACDFYNCPGFHQAEGSQFAYCLTDSGIRIFVNIRIR